MFPLLVLRVGFEPTNSEENRFTACRLWPLGHLSIWYEYGWWGRNRTDLTMLMRHLSSPELYPSMARRDGFEPPSLVLETSILPLNYLLMVIPIIGGRSSQLVGVAWTPRFQVFSLDNSASTNYFSVKLTYFFICLFQRHALLLNHLRFYYRNATLVIRPFRS